MASASLTPPPPRDRSNFTIAVICALPLEAECVYDALDHVWKDKKYANAPGDHNAYTLGVIADHNVVVLHMPGMGTTRAAYAVSDLKTSFPNIELALVVGVCGGMPYTPDHRDIFLGDVIISKALVQYTFGKQYPRGFERKTGVLDTLGAPSEKILSLLAKLETRQYMQDIQANTVIALRAIQQKSSKTQHPGVDRDILYHSSYVHQHRLPKICETCMKGDEICKVAVEAKCEDLECDSVMRITRRRQVDPLTAQPTIHIGLMGSGDTVMKSGRHRDALAQHEGIVAAEMEGAGIWRYGPSLVIKGVCDYADSHKRKGWQQYAAAAAAACAKAFLMEWTSKQGWSTSVDRASVNEYFVVSRQRVKRLFGRDEELAKIASYFDRDADDGQPRIVVLQAMGGQGKSQIALEYCHRTRCRYRAVFWVNASSTATTTQSLASIAEVLDSTAIVTLSDDDAKAAFAIRTLERWEQRWLMVFDNCDDAATFYTLQDKFLPQVGRGSILVTGRHKDLAELGEFVEIPPMPQEAGVQLLLHRYRNVNPNDYLLTGKIIVDRLGNLALAIDQASAFMQYTCLPINKLDTFLPKYLTQRQKVLGYTTQNFWQYTKIGDTDARNSAISAFTTWEMSFQQLLANQSNRDHVAHFLTLSAFFGQTAVHESLFRLHLEQSQAPPSWMTIFVTRTSENVQEDSTVQSSAEFDLSQAFEQTGLDDSEHSWQADQFWYFIFQAFQTSLLQSILPTTEEWEAGFLLHPLIRDWLQLRLVLEERQAYTREATDVLTSSIRTYTAKTSDANTNRMILLHMDAVLACDNEFSDNKFRLGRDISTCDHALWFASFYADQGKYSEAEQIYRVVVEVQERVLGSENCDTLTSMNNLATVLTNQGKLNEAEQMNLVVVKLRERVLGSEHPNTLTSMNNLGEVLSHQGKHDEAEQIYRTVIEVRERVLGSEHPNTLTSLNNLALVLCYQSKHDEAEEIYRAVVGATKRVLGSEHPNALVSMNNLAAVLSEQCNFIEAEGIQLQVIKSALVVHGLQHPWTQLYLRALKVIWECQGREPSQIESMVQDILAGRNGSQL